MTQEFPHFYIALEWTLKYYSIYSIKDEFRLISTDYKFGGLNLESVEDSFQLVLTLQNRMESEIQNTIQNCYPATQIIHLDLLKDWLGDYRIERTNEELVRSVIDTYNQDLYDKFLVDANAKEDEFKKTVNYQIGHDVEYSYEKEILNYSYGLMSPLKTGRKETVIGKNNWFFCLDRTPEYLNPIDIPSYLLRLDRLINNFRRILKKYVELYDKGKLPVAHQQTVIIQPINTHEEIKSLPTPLVSPTKKLKVNLSVEQLAYLFRLLNDEGLINAESNIEIQDFISKNFETHRVGKHKDISKTKLAGAFSTPEASTAKSWIPILKKMWEKAAKI